MKKNLFLSIIVPAYNEEVRIRYTLASILKYFKKTGWRFQIIVVNDGSTDSTSKVVTEFAKHNRLVQLVEYNKNQGKGYAVKTSVLSSPHSDFWLLTDADNSTPIDQFEKLFGLVQDFDIVIGSRHLHDSQVSIRQAWHRHLFSRLSNWLIRQLVLPDFQDTQCGFKLFNKNCLPIFKKQQIKGFAFDIEILARAKRRGLKIKEVPIGWNDKPFSKMTGKKAFLALWELLKIRKQLGKVK